MSERDFVQSGRYAATMIGLTTIVGYIVNLALFPLISLAAQPESGSAASIAWNCVLYLAVFFLPCFVLSRLHGWTMGELNGAGRPSASVFGMVLCLAVGWNFVATLMGGGIEAFLNQFGVTEGGSGYVLPKNAAAAALQMLQIAVLPPIVEELCFRGFYLKLSRRAMGTWPAIVLTSAVFWLSHNSLSILPLAFGFGVLGGLLRVRYQSLLPSMFAHFVINASYLLINFVQHTAPNAVQNLFFDGLLAVELACLIGGCCLAVRSGLLDEARRLVRAARRLPKEQIACGIFTSIPFWMLLLSAAYFTGKGLSPL